MRNIYCMVGSPGAGKSTWIEENGLAPYALSPDLIRLMFQSPQLNVDGSYSISQRNDKDVWETLFSLLRRRCERGELSIIDAVHSKESDWAKYKEFADYYRYRIYAIDFRDVPESTALEQNASRNNCKFVPEDVIKNIYSRFKSQKIPGYVNVIKPTEFLDTTKIRWLDFNKYKSIYIFGDIHGSIQPVNDFFAQNPFSEENGYVMVGDFCDRSDTNGEMFKFVMSIFNRPNVVILQSNHGEHLKKYAFDRESEIRSSEFLNRTVPQLLAAGISKGDIRNVALKEAQLCCFEYHGKKWVVTHGGVPIVPDAFVPTINFIKGVGDYGDMEIVAESWLKNTPEDTYSVCGHRNVNSIQTKVNDRFYNLEGKVEFGGHLRILEIKPEETNCLEFKNNNFRSDLTQFGSKKVVTESEPNSSTESNLELLDYVTYLRSNKNVFENKYDDGISSFNFKKDVFYKNKYGEVKNLPRGFFVNRNTGKVVCKGYNKFFNLSEVTETSPVYLNENLNFPCEVYVKENGFLGLLGYDEVSRKLVFTSKSTIGGEFAKWFEDLFYEKHASVVEFVTEYLATTNSCMAFEVVLPKKDPHIIEEKEDKLILLDIFQRDLSNKKLSYDGLAQFSIKTGIYCKILAKVLNNVEDLNNFLNNLPHNDSTIEGFVVEDYDGFMFKIKLQYYKKWKFLRGIKEKMSKGHQVNLGQLRNPEENDFYGFLKGKSRDQLAAESIISLRNEFLTL